MNPLRTTLAALAALLLTACQNPTEPSVALAEDAGRMVFQSAAGAELLSYQFETYPAPEGQNPAYARSGFIHPVRSPSGIRLTQIQPADHYHHYGIWNPWTQVEFRGQTVDFWNLHKEQGTVRFAGFENQRSDPNSSELTALHEHVVFHEDGSETVALLEQQTLRVTESSDPQTYLVDLVFNYRCGTDDPFKILEYRYGGLGWRAHEAWNAENSSVLTSEGIARPNADGSLARWVIGQATLDGHTAGLAILSHPSNYNHPEPLRVWPESAHGGQLFLTFSPIKTASWTLEPGQTYTLRYRLVVFDGPYTAEAADAAWSAFAQTP